SEKNRPQRGQGARRPGSLGEAEQETSAAPPRWARTAPIRRCPNRPVGETPPAPSRHTSRPPKGMWPLLDTARSAAMVRAVGNPAVSAHSLADRGSSWRHLEATKIRGAVRSRLKTGRRFADALPI